MSGVVKQVGKLVGIGGSSTQTSSNTSSNTTATSAVEKPVARMATPEERALALRRRRGSRSLLSEERMNAESGLGGDQTTLGGM